MIETALQNALDGVWANTIGRLAWLVPDWVAWLFSYPADVWVLWFIAMAIGYVAGRWGLLALAAVGGLLIAVFTLGRKSKAAPSAPDPVAHEKPPVKDPPRRKTLLDIFRGRN